MARNIMICFDGTNEEPLNAKQPYDKEGNLIVDESITNVLKLHVLFGGNNDNSSERSVGLYKEQLSFYYKGVGTYRATAAPNDDGWFAKIGRALDFIFSRVNTYIAPLEGDIKTILDNSLRDLKATYRAKDKLFIFGFSRGAAIARMFASKLADDKNFNDPNLIEFLGVFDTVASIEGASIGKGSRPIVDVLFEKHTISPLIGSALHLVSLDEKRTTFKPTLMNEDERVTEVWFPGDHGDVGGGYWKDSLSDISLDFMIKWIKKHHLSVKILEIADPENGVKKTSQVITQNISDKMLWGITEEHLKINKMDMGATEDKHFEKHSKGDWESTIATRTRANGSKLNSFVN